MSDKKNINFGFIDNPNCILNDPDFTGQCCCKCTHRLKVVAHCLHVAHDQMSNPLSCNCGDEMGFYVCTVFDHMEPRTGTASICGEHGLCECFTKKKDPENRALV